MLFSEIHGRYYDMVAKIIETAQNGSLDRKQLECLVHENGFEESTLTIPNAIMSKEWPFITDDWTTPIRSTPSRPLRLLEKQWLKAVLLDPRVKLFDVDARWLDDVEPLYTPDTFVYYDQYSDGDPFEDEHYINVFRTLLKSINAGKQVILTFYTRSNVVNKWHGTAKNLEYSLKDDKFRLRLTIDDWHGQGSMERTVNVAQIMECVITDEDAKGETDIDFINKELIFEIIDERNAMERVLLHFSHFEKSAERIGNNKYRVTLKYQHEDEKELANRILSFGPMIKVISPQEIVNRIRTKVKTQLEYSPNL